MERIEEFKAYENIKRPDERSERILPSQLIDLHRILSAIDITNSAPAHVLSHFNTGKNLYLYSWFHYPFKNASEAHLFTTLEMALRYKIKGAMWPSQESGPGLSALLQEAHKQHLFTLENLPEEANCGITDENFHTFKSIICSMRNDYSHGSPTLVPRLWPIHMIASIINQIYSLPPQEQ